MSNVSDWAVFARVAELKSLSSAGRELRLSSAVVSNRIAKLEKEHGVRLLNRTTRRVNVTAEGQVFYEHCTRILDEIATIEASIGSRSEFLKGPITVTAPAGFGRKHVAPLLPGFVEENPGLEVRLHLTDRLTDVIAEGTDVAIRIADLKQYSFIAKKLANNKRMIVGSPGYLESTGHPKSLPICLSTIVCFCAFPAPSNINGPCKGRRRNCARSRCPAISTVTMVKC